MEKSVAFCTLGCKVNQYESEAVLEQFIQRGYQQVDFSEQATVYVVNTCTVTHLSDRKSRQMIRRAKQANPDAVLIVMGCYAQTNPAAVSAIPGVDIVIGTDKRSEAAALAEQIFKERRQVNLVVAESGSVFEPLTIDGCGQNHTRAFLKVQDGCNQFCSYCIIPYARGRIRSRGLDDSVREAERLASAGFHELVLTGIHLASWGKDSGEGTLLDLLQALQAAASPERIRLSSLEPTLCNNSFIQGVASLSKVCHHFHLSLQSGCDTTLKRMNRRYTTAEYWDAVEKIRAVMPEAALTTDLIVGFPQETESEFAETLSFVDRLCLADAHIFKYSPREGTPAAAMAGQVAPEIKEERSHRLLQLTEQNKEAFARRFIGKIETVLFERCAEPGIYEGKTGNYLTVYAPAAENITGRLIPVRLTAYQQGALWGTISEA